MLFTIDDFKKVSANFKLGSISTEAFHPKSMKLSDVVKKDVAAAVEILTDIDNDALTVLKQKSAQVFELQKSCQSVLKSKNKVYISGCGATGRLALSIEKLYRSKYNSDQVVAFMAGGDFALIKSVESFEDNLSYGQRQLKDLGFTDKDLLIGITEGGETTFVIGSTLYAAKSSIHKPYFLYCNPDSELMSIERSKLVIENEKVNKLNLGVGPMAISGSTRMQATTVQMIAAGFAILFDHSSFEEFELDYHSFIEELMQAPKAFISDFIKAEYSLYKKKGRVTYKAPEDIAISILTDTTERSPTFSLQGFEKIGEESLSLSYLCIEGSNNSQEAWEKLLSRHPRCLEWADINLPIDTEQALKFDISEGAISRRQKLCEEHKIFAISSFGNLLKFDFDGLEFEYKHHRDLFFSHMYLKLTLNIHSTLIMGLLERFEGNMMTYVRPSNFKLIDRAYRYINELLRRENLIIPESRIIEKIFQYQDSGSQEPVVIYVRDQILKEKN